MRRIFAVGILLSAITLPGRAFAATTGLISLPLLAGAGGVACSCTNLTTIDIDLAIGVLGGVPAFINLDPGERYTGTAFPGPLQPVGQCEVFRQNGGQLTTKQVLCSFISMHPDGTPSVVVPVDQKRTYPF
jgi:hypothetical protein